MKSSSRYILVRLFPTFISQKRSEPNSVLTFSSGNRALAAVSCTFCRPHRPKVLRARHFFFNDVYVKPSSCYSPACILSTSSSKSAPRPSVSNDLLWNRALATVTVLCTFCRPLVPIEPRNRGNRDPPSATTAATLPEKIQGFAMFRARECFQAWIHALPISHTSQLLAWWCGCHDDWGDHVVAIMVRKVAMTIVRNSEVS